MNNLVKRYPLLTFFFTILVIGVSVGPLAEQFSTWTGWSLSARGLDIAIVSALVTSVFFFIFLKTRKSFLLLFLGLTFANLLAKVTAYIHIVYIQGGP